MAKYTIQHKCGHESVAQLYGKQKDREWQIEKLQEENCLECQNSKAAEKNAEAGLPELQGSEKQVAWAESIRAQLIRQLEEAKDVFIKEQKELAEIDEKEGPRESQTVSGGRFKGMSTPGGYRAMDQYKKRAEKAIEKIRLENRASWWIEHREGFSFGQLAREIDLTDIEPEAKAEKEEQGRLEAEAKAEATMYAPEPKTSTICEIRFREIAEEDGNPLKCIELDLPERIEEFRKLVRYEHKFDWTGKVWRRALKKSYDPDPAEKMAELGAVLLRSGFNVRIYDAEIRERIQNGDYKAENTKIVAYNPEKSCFIIQWLKRDGDYYQKARKLPASKYIKPFVGAPVEYWQEVEDFANEHGFKFSPSAQEQIDIQRRAFENATTVNPEKPETEEKPVERDFSQREFDVDEELRDDN